MAEVIGVIASVLTLCKVVAGGVALARGLSNVAAEVKTLEEQLQNLQTILQTVEAAGKSASEQPVLATPLARLRTCMQDIHTLLGTKLLRQRRGITKVRRTAWLRHKGRVVALSESLKSAHDGLHLALTTAILYEALFPDARISIIHIVISLSTTKQLPSAAIVSQSWSRQVDQKAGSLWVGGDNGILVGAIAHQEVAGTIEEPPLLFRQLPWSTSASPDGQLLRLSLESIQQDVDEIVEEMDVDVAPRCSPELLQILAPAPAASQSSSNSTQNHGPWTGLTALPGEAYATASLTPRLVGHCEFETARNQFSRTNRYSMFYTKAPRQWIRLEVSLTVSVESKAWLAFQAPPKDKYAWKRRFHGLPETLLSQLQIFLESRKNLRQDTHLDVYIGGAGLASPTICARQPSFDTSAYLKRKWEKLFHMGCPYFNESDVAQGPSKTPSNDRDFLANLGSGWMLEHRIGAHKAAIKYSLNNLKILHCMSGNPRFRRLFGVVLDDTGTMKSFLTELTGGGRIVRHLGPSVSWARREKWCRQVVEAVVSVHAKGFVVGKLGSLLGTWIDLDRDDNIVISRFSKAFRQHPGCDAMVPSEHRSRSSRGRYIKCSYITATPPSDVYHMGIQLFVIAANIQNSDPLELCTRIHGGSTCRKVCPGHGNDPPQLRLNNLDGMPSYLARIIKACLAEKEKRPAAWQILGQFPPPAPGEAASTPQTGRQGAPVHHVARPVFEACPMDQQTIIRSSKNKFCSYCRELTVSSRFFHCAICSYNFYDLCPACFEKGAHCKDPMHYLTENWLGRPHMGKLYSCVKESGLREVLDLDE